MSQFRSIALPLLVALASQSTFNAAVAETGEESRGRDVYLAHGCHACHGYNGVGAYALSPETSGIVSNDEVFIAFLRARADVRPSLPKQWMPHYPESSLSDSDAIAMLAYIRGFDDNPPRVVDSETLSTILEGARESSH